MLINNINLSVNNFMILQQYVSTATSGYTLVSDGLIVYRKGERDGLYVIDYSDDGGATWTLELISWDLTEDIIEINIDYGVDGYRHLVRDGAYVIDQELTETGFAGTEGVDWEEIISIQG